MKYAASATIWCLLALARGLFTAEAVWFSGRLTLRTVLLAADLLVVVLALVTEVFAAALAGPLVLAVGVLVARVALVVVDLLTALVRVPVVLAVAVVRVRVVLRLAEAAVLRFGVVFSGLSSVVFFAIRRLLRAGWSVEAADYGPRSVGCKPQLLHS